MSNLNDLEQLVDQINTAITERPEDEPVTLSGLDVVPSHEIVVGSRMWNGGKPYARELGSGAIRLVGDFKVTGLALEVVSGLSIEPVDGEGTVVGVAALVSDNTPRFGEIHQYGFIISPDLANDIAGVALGETAQYFDTVTR